MNANAMNKEREPDTRSARERLLETAGSLFYEQGYRATGINQVIDEADVAKATFYNHFDSKEALAAAYVSRKHDEWMDGLENFLRGERRPEDRVRVVFEFLATWARETGFRGCAFLNLAAEFPDPRSRVREKIARHKTELREKLSSLARESAPSDADESEVQNRADELYLLVEGALVESQVHEGTWPIESARRAAVRAVVGPSDSR